MSDESRMVKDPICGKDVDTLRARAVGIFGGVTYYFCSAECKAKYVDPRKGPRASPTASADSAVEPAAAPEAGARSRREASDAADRERRAGALRALAHAAGDRRGRRRRSVQIDLSPQQAQPKRGAGAAVGDEPLEPARSGARLGARRRS